MNVRSRYDYGSIAQGTLNRDQEDFGNIQSAEPGVTVRKAFCSSVWCAPRNKKGKLIDTYRMREKKGVPKDAVSCPDCKNVLYWDTRKV